MQGPQSAETVIGTFSQVIFSPHGSIEGIIVEGAEGKTQCVFSDEQLGAIFSHVEVGAPVVIEGEFVGWSSSRKEGHRVYRVDGVRSINKKKPLKPKAIKRAPTYSGTVVSLNYARHGEPNGVILDSGDFIHLKPEGFKRAKLAVGDHVEAFGDAHELSAERGYAVEATRVNGRKLA